MGTLRRSAEAVVLAAGTAVAIWMLSLTVPLVVEHGVGVIIGDSWGYFAVLSGLNLTLQAIFVSRLLRRTPRKSSKAIALAALGVVAAACAIPFVTHG